MAAAKKSPNAVAPAKVAPAAPAAKRAAAPAPAQDKDTGPAWVATTPLRYQGERIEAGNVIPGLTAEQAAELGDLVEPATAEAADTGAAEGASTDTTTED